MTAKLPITAVILAFNEETHIARCLARIVPVVERVVVVDSFSTDQTAGIARENGADVLQNPWTNYATQFQWALDHAQLRTPWVLRLDADEYLEAALALELRKKLSDLPPDVTGISFRRKVIFRGRWIRWGGYYPTVLLRLWRRDAARIEARWMDEHMVLTRGRSITFSADLVDENLHDISWWTAKHNSYATRQMIDFIAREEPLFPRDRAIETAGGSFQARRRRFLRDRVFARAPLYLRATLYFLFRYFALLGFLDGRQGFVFHFLQGWWNWMLVDAKIDEARRLIRAEGLDAFRSHCLHRHGIAL
ncbi:MAG: glycosyltransferase family 2 protein [Mesorhizobium amorphae]|nr:MAG: glycosyltransferase family 2 protein [Mesorhizobium amorphae]